jgi:hypothetical protein
MKSNLYQGMAMFLTASVLVGGILWAMLSQATVVEIESTDLPDQWVCAEAIAWGFKYMSETDAQTIQDGIWQIIKSPELDDSQTYVTLMVFHTIQQISWNVTDNPQATGGNPNRFWLNTLNRINLECEYQLNEQRFPSE